MTYPNDLKQKEWEQISHHFERRDPRGRNSKHDKKAIVDAILYVLKSGCQWRMLPKEYPSWKRVYDHFSRWNKRGVWEAALDELNRTYRKGQKKVHPKLWDSGFAKREDDIK